MATDKLWQLFPPYPGEQPASRVDFAKLYADLGVYRKAAEKTTSTEPEGATNLVAGHAHKQGVLAILEGQKEVKTFVSGFDINDWASNLGFEGGKGSNNWVCRPPPSGTLHILRHQAQTRLTPSAQPCPACPLWCWAVLDADNQTVLAGLKTNQAQSLDELFAAFALYHSPTQSVVATDVQGKVGFKAAGKIPLRKPDNDILGMAPSPGWDARYDWAGWVPYSSTRYTLQDAA
jgi:hypothetical protein